MDKLLSIYQQAFNELCVIDSIVQLTRKSCEDYEFSGQYYGISYEMVARLSAERNNYINMLNIVSERITNIINLNLSMEKEILLQQYSNNSR